MDNAANDRFLRRTDVQNMVGLGCSSIYALMQEADPEIRFPAAIKIGQRSRWSERAVRDWMARQEARPAA